MSSILTPLDLASAPVGFQGSIDFDQSNDPTNPAHLWLFNESGCDLDLTFQASNRDVQVSADEWALFALQPDDAHLAITVTQTGPSRAPGTLKATYYGPGETVPNFQRVRVA